MQLKRWNRLITPANPSSQKKIAIIGGGVSGLAAAYRATSALPSAQITLFESSSRLGGVLQTEHADGYLIEKSADMFTTEPSAALELCQMLGKTDQLIQTTPTPDRAFVLLQNGIHPVPKGLSLLLPNDLDSISASPLLDDDATRRFLAERDVPPRDWSTDESLESFAVRRFGQSAFDNLIQPLVGGIYTADPKKLSMLATMSRFVEMEKNHGSLIRAAENANSKPTKRKQSDDQQASGARYGLFRAPLNGMGELIQWINDALTQSANPVEIKTNCLVSSLKKLPHENTPAEKTRTDWVVGFDQLGIQSQDHFDGVVIASSAQQSALLTREVDDSLSKKLQTITGASSAIVVLGFPRSLLSKTNNFSGYGIIVPSALNRQVIATSYSSNKFEGRSPEEKILIRCFIGGALQSELVNLNDDQLTNIALNELSQTVGLEKKPTHQDLEIVRVFRWRNCMPQYHLGHLERVSEIDALIAEHSGLELAGNSYHGVGVPACIESGFAAVDRMKKSLN